MSDELRIHMTDATYKREARCLASRQRIEQADVQVLDSSVSVNAVSSCALYETRSNQQVTPVRSSKLKLPMADFRMNTEDL